MQPEAHSQPRLLTPPPPHPPGFQLRDTILRYEEQAGLPSSREVLDELAATHAQQANQQSGGTVEEMHDSTGTAATDTAVEGAAGTRREEL